MPSKSDTAKQIADLCNHLRDRGRKPTGAVVISQAFGVEPWSADFLELIYILTRRLDELQDLVRNLGDGVDDDIKEQAVAHIQVLRKAFGPDGLSNAWSHATDHFITSEHVNALKMISPQIRHVQPLPLLNAEEKQEILDLVDDLLGWLAEHQIHDQDFIRQAIIEGLERFRFRLERVSWLGWGYTLDSLKEVIGAYLALERGLDPNAQPDGAEVLRKVGGALKKVFKTIGVAKDASEKGTWLIDAYKNISALGIGAQGVAAVLNQLS